MGDLVTVRNAAVSAGFRYRASGPARTAGRRPRWRPPPEIWRRQGVTPKILREFAAPRPARRSLKGRHEVNNHVDAESRGSRWCGARWSAGERRRGPRSGTRGRAEGGLLAQLERVPDERENLHPGRVRGGREDRHDRGGGGMSALHDRVRGVAARVKQGLAGSAWTPLAGKGRGLPARRSRCSRWWDRAGRRGGSRRRPAWGSPWRRRRRRPPPRRRRPRRHGRRRAARRRGRGGGRGRDDAGAAPSRRGRGHRRTAWPPTGR